MIQDPPLAHSLGSYTPAPQVDCRTLCKTLALALSMAFASESSIAIQLSDSVGERHYLEFDRRGEPVSQDAFAGVLDGIRGHDSGRLLFFVHGANNSFRRSARRANEQTPLILATGQYPVFVNWSSSFATSYRDDLFRIHQGKDGGAAASSALAPFRFAADVAKMLFRAPWVGAQQFRTMVRTRPGVRRNEDILQGVIKLQAAWPGHISIGPTCKKNRLRGARTFLTGTVTAPTTKLATNMVMDAFGPGSWDVLQRRTRVLFEKDAYFRTGTNEPPGGGPWAPQNGRLEQGLEAGGLARFLDELLALIEAEPSRNWEIVLAVHSTGALVANEIVRRYPPDILPTARIVYMAAASSIEDFDRDIIAPLRRNPDTAPEVLHLTLHHLQENRQSMLWDVGPRGTIIVAVDNFIDKPKTLGGRVAGRLDNLVRHVQKWPEFVQKKSWVRAFGAGKCSATTNQPRKHGHFSTRFRYWEDACIFPSETFPAWCGDLSLSKPDHHGRVE